MLLDGLDVLVCVLAERDTSGSYEKYTFRADSNELEKQATDSTLRPLKPFFVAAADVPFA